jgi:hypothetical protein
MISSCSIFRTRTASGSCSGVVDDPDIDWCCESRRTRHSGIEGKFDGISVRVPTPNVSLVDVGHERREGNVD